MLKRKGISIALIITMVAMLTGGCASNIINKETTSKNENGVENNNNENGVGNSNTENNVGNSNTNDAFDITNEYTEEEKKTDYSDEVNDNKIMFNDMLITTSGSGMKVEGNVVKISEAGVYTLSGTLSDGQVVVKCDTGTVVLVLDNVNMSCSTSAPIYAKKSEMLIVNLPAGTTNTLNDASTYVYENPEDDEPNACLYSDDNLTINGEGTLIVNGNYNNGVAAKDVFKLVSGNVTIKAKNNGLKGKDGVVISGGQIDITSDGDGIKADNTTDTTKGYVLIEGGDVKIKSGEDGIQAETCLKITAGVVDIYTGGGSSVTSNNNNDWGQMRPGGFWGNSSSSSTTTETVSKKGLKAGVDITIVGGNVIVDSEDDSVHTNSTITIDGGDLTLSSGDDGIHSDKELTISNGNVKVLKSYEGIESTTINIKGGTIDATASDDGINAAGGDGSSTGGRPGMNSFTDSSGSINITGGVSHFNAGGDGVDANGNISMTGGTVYIDGPTNNGNGTVDHNGKFVVLGGELIGVGTSGTGEITTASGNVNQVLIYLTQSSSNDVIIKDSNGNILVNYDAAKSYSMIIFASEKLVKGETYTIYLGDTKYDSFTVTSSSTTVGSGGGGMGGPGGMRPGRW